MGTVRVRNSNGTEFDLDERIVANFPDDYELVDPARPSGRRSSGEERDTDRDPNARQF